MALIDYEGFDSFTTMTQVPGRFNLNINPSNTQTTNVGLGVYGTGRAHAPGGNTGGGRSFANTQVCWCNFHFQQTAGVDNGSNVWQWMDAATQQLGLRFMATGRIDLYRGPTTLINSSALGIISLNVWHFIQMRVSIDNAVGTAEVWVDGVKVIDFTGNTRNTANNFVNGWQSIGSGGNPQLDNVVIYDETGASFNTRSGETRVLPAFPNADGAVNQWTPSTGVDNWAVVDENPPNGDTDYMSAASPLTNLFGFPAVVPAGSTIYALALQGMSRKDDAGVNELDYMVRSGGTNYPAGSPFALSASYAWERFIWQTDPDTPGGTGPWTSGSVAASQGGVERTT